MKHIVRRIFVVGVLSVMSVSQSAYAKTAKSYRPPQFSAQASILVDARTGQILYEKHAFRQMDPASLTKIMTAIITIEHGHLSRRVTISRRAAGTIGSKLHMRAGQQYTVDDLLKGLLLRSGNDAAVALAEADAGSVGRFVAEMDIKAQELGAFNTTFENPNGLTAPGHYSSAFDLAMITQAALRLPLFRTLVASREATVTELTHQRSRVIHNTNRLLYGFSGADGVKTGTTNAAGKCLVASATRQGRQLIAVVLNSSNRWGDASRLLSWGFSHWQLINVVHQGQTIAQVTVTDGVVHRVGLVSERPVWVSLPVGAPYKVRYIGPQRVAAPIGRKPLGTVLVTSPDLSAIRVPLVPKRTVAKKPPVRKFWNFLRRWL